MQLSYFYFLELLPNIQCCFHLSLLDYFDYYCILVHFTHRIYDSDICLFKEFLTNPFCTYTGFSTIERVSCLQDCLLRFGIGLTTKIFQKFSVNIQFEISPHPPPPPSCKPASSSATTICRVSDSLLIQLGNTHF